MNPNILMAICWFSLLIPCLITLWFCRRLDHAEHKSRAFMSSNREAEVAEQIAVAALKALRIEETVCVMREGSHSAAKGKLTFSTTPGVSKNN